MKAINRSLLLLLASPVTGFALEPMSNDDLDTVTGQGGVYLSGDLTINENGGPLNSDGPAAWQSNCTAASTDSKCGARIAVNTGSSSTGWFVLDNIRGRFSFEGLTLKTRTINSGFVGDGAQFNSEVLEVGLPNTLDYENVSLTVANSNSPRPTDVGFQQTDIFTLNINGQANLQGNLLVYPTGTP
ncbi:hypothetical protein [Thalassolituus marinus]|uniref:Uncharacterized protein n=1 Tax=Thalassolituus marinus TaxID=671053 RepID=A0ABS7ZSG8_9GAMM|nr:hypothetical protein [Thalassolituus marinus]MCA6063465.1 hypothetical protein [Thalassolituus marinus]